jgi:EAL domain-containing protein (putative c-di-GMP-specific phosphodiesterase class I)
MLATTYTQSRILIVDDEQDNVLLMKRILQETNATILAEGIETDAELLTLKTLGVPWGQGFQIGRPNHEENALHAVYKIS